MKFFKNLKYGFYSYGTAIKFISKNHMKRYFLFPVLLNIVFYLLGFVAAGELSDHLLNYIESLLQTDSWEFMGSEFLANSIHFILWLVLKLLTFLIIAFLGGHVVLICMSPILGIVSEKTEYILSKKEYPSNFKQIISDTIRGIRIAARNFFLELGVIMLLFILSFIPLVGFLSPFILFLVASYYYGFSFLDYNLERKKYSPRESANYMKQNRGLVVGNGIMYALILMIPILGVTLSAFGSIVSTVAATLSLHKKQVEEQQIEGIRA